MENYKYDSRYLDVGQIPTHFALYSFDAIFARPFTLQELLLIHSSKSLDTYLHTLRAIDLVTSCDIYELTDGDLAYLMGWLRLYSYPSAPTNAIWDCKYPVYRDSKGRYIGKKDEVDRREIVVKSHILQPCANKNVYLSHGAKIFPKMLASVDLPDGLDFPRVKTLLEAEDWEDDDPKIKNLLPALRCIKAGETLKDKYEIAKDDWQLFLSAQKFSKQFTHGIQEYVPIECMECGTRDTIIRPVSLKSFLFGHSEDSIYDMQYNLMSAFHITPDDNMPAKRFLYHHSCFVKDMKERKEKEKIAREAAKRNKGKP